jgi:hypothetical protein
MAPKIYTELFRRLLNRRTKVSRLQRFPSSVKANIRFGLLDRRSDCRPKRTGVRNVFSLIFYPVGRETFDCLAAEFEPSARKNEQLGSDAQQ